MTTLTTASSLAEAIYDKIGLLFNVVEMYPQEQAVERIQQFLNEHLQAQHEKTWKMAIKTFVEPLRENVKWVKSVYELYPCPPINESTNNGTE